MDDHNKSKAQLLSELKMLRQRLARLENQPAEQQNYHLQTLATRWLEELTLAQRIQKSLLPPAQLKMDGLHISCFSYPAQEVGGDFYAYQPIINSAGEKTRLESFMIAVGDASGKGMPAALLMAISLASFHTAIAQALSPGQLLAYLDQTILPYTQTTRQYCALVYVEIRSGLLKVANAGCIPPLLRRADGRIKWIEVGGVPLGVGLGARAGYREVTSPLRPNDFIVLTSDGVVEAKNKAGEMFGFERLEQAIINGPAHNPEALLAHLQTAIADFTADEESHDDLTAVVLQFEP